MNTMTPQQYEQYIAFQNNRQSYRVNRTPEQKEYFYEQVKRRVVNYLYTIGRHNLEGYLAQAFWGESKEHDSEKAISEAVELGYIPEDGKVINDSPYFWYNLLKPHARNMAQTAKAFTSHFEKL
jgi:hypothetical protein